MTFGKSFLFVHREAFAFMLACPLIALIPILAELLQHYVEMGIGMYDGVEGAKAAEASASRMQFGMLKVAALSVMSYPVIRFVAGNRNAAAARSLEPRALKLFSGVLAISLGTAALDLFVLRSYPVASLSLFAASLVFGPLLLRWYAGAPLGVWISPLQSTREMLPVWLWAFGLTFMAMLPLMIMHYALSTWAIFATATLKWPVLIADSLVVGLLSAVMAGTQWVAANRPGPLLQKSPSSRLPEAQSQGAG